MTGRSKTKTLSETIRGKLATARRDMCNPPTGSASLVGPAMGATDAAGRLKRLWPTQQTRTNPSACPSRGGQIERLDADNLIGGMNS